jgi:hypothetical protein
MSSGFVWRVMNLLGEETIIIQFILLFDVLNRSLSTQRYVRIVCDSVWFAAVIMYLLYQSLRALVLVQTVCESLGL